MSDSETELTEMMELDDETELKNQKNRMKGRVKHDLKETNRYQRLNLRKYDVVLDEDTVFSTRVFNSVKESQRRVQQNYQGRGKWKKKGG